MSAYLMHVAPAIGSGWPRLVFAGLLACICGCSTSSKGIESSEVGYTPPISEAPSAIEEPISRSPCEWRLYEAYAKRFVESGRVVDITTNARSTSEGQSYGLFFALVANDLVRFEQILTWTKANLMQGSWGKHLPAWLWGADQDGKWHVLDPNPATDADLWIAYTLIEASRLWNRPKYLKMGLELLRLSAKANIRRMGSLGPMLLPAPMGFELQPRQRWRLNPSYFVFVQLKRFAAVDPTNPWKGIQKASEEMLVRTAKEGHSPDWIIYDAKAGFVPDTQLPPASSYDAVRVAMWAAFGAPKRVQAAVSGRLSLFEATNFVREKISLDRQGAKELRSGPPGFVASLIPVAMALEKPQTTEKLRTLLSRYRRGELYGRPSTYYDQNLVLFGLGFAEDRFHFDSQGKLHVFWKGLQCSS